MYFLKLCMSNSRVICSAIETEPESTKKSNSDFITLTTSSSLRVAKQTETTHSGGFASSYDSPSAVRILVQHLYEDSKT